MKQRQTKQTDLFPEQHEVDDETPFMTKTSKLNCAY